MWLYREVQYPVDAIMRLPIASEDTAILRQAGI